MSACTQAEQAARKKAEELLKASELREKQATAAYEAQAADRSATAADKAALAKERQELEQMQSDIIAELQKVHGELQSAQRSLHGIAQLPSHAMRAYKLRTVSGIP